jgi:high-affinity nickel permease
MFAILGLGFLLGMLHGLEADHIAAIGVNAIVATGFA